jgi:hypothetical protein
MAWRVNWLLLLLGVMPAGVVRAQAPAADVVYSRQLQFRIPFQTEPGERRIQQVQLYVSLDQGQSWQAYASATPEQGSFLFRADRDALYWFAVRTMDHEQRFFPPTLDGLKPGLKVQVDSHEPQASLQVLPPQGSSVGVSWTVRDDNLDPASLRLEQRLAGSGEWQVVAAEGLPASGQRYWNPATNATLEVRLRARDRADNWGEARTTVAPGSPTAGAVANPASAAATGGPAVRMVNSKRVSLDYDIDELPPSGISVVELWYTQDGRSWQKYTEERFDAGRVWQRKPFVFDINEEGVYGFTLLARSGVDLGPRPPQVGDPPHVWIEVDLTKPVVQLLNVDVGRNQELGNLTVTWRATDKNLTRQPITLSYAERPEGPWTPIATNLENTGRYVWRMPVQGVPLRFLVRVEAVDKAGNVAAVETTQPVIADLKIPSIRLRDVKPAGTLD